jgi:hypothetical protein
VECATNGDCRFQATGRNVGGGCARAVSGTLRLMNANGAQLGAPATWAVSGTLGREEEFTYKTNERVSAATIAGTRSYFSEASWSTTAC